MGTTQGREPSDEGSSLPGRVPQQVPAEYVELRRRYAKVEARVAHLEGTAWIGGVVAVLFGTVAGLLLTPFLISTDRDEEQPSFTLIRLAFEAMGSASDPDAFEGISGLLALAVFLLTGWSVLQLGAAMSLWGRSIGRTGFRVCRVITVVQLVGCAAAWLMVWLLSANVDDVRGYSPGLLLLTAGALVGVALTGPGKAWVRVR